MNLSRDGGNGLMGVIRWEDPPGQMRGTKPKTADEWGSVADELRAYPKRWGILYEGEQGVVANIVNSITGGRWQSFRPGGSFEAVSRKRDEVARCYVRYVGVDPAGDLNREQLLAAIQGVRAVADRCASGEWPECTGPVTGAMLAEMLAALEKIAGGAS